MALSFFKSRYSLFFVPLFLVSCYSPKSDIEKDKHPEIPEFPKFDSPDVHAEKIAELKVEKGTGYTLSVRKDRLFVYLDGPQDPVDEYKEWQTLLSFRNGYLLNESSWKDYADGGPFFTPDGNLYLGNQCFFAPAYAKKKEVPHYSMVSVQNEYQEEHHFSNGANEAKEVSEIQLKLQSELFGRIRTICQIYGGSDNSRFDPVNAVYLCNARSGSPFYIDGDLFNDMSLTKSGEKKYGLNDTYMDQVRPKVSFVQEEQLLGLDPSNVDEAFFKETGSVVVGNKWHSYGNHVVGSCGYTPVYMYYYDVDYKGKTVKTKESKLKWNTSTPVKVNGAWYFLSMNTAGTKLVIYYLK